MDSISEPYSQSRKIHIHIDINNDELAALKGALQITGLTQSDYIRRLILGRNIKPLPPVDYITFARQLQYVGNNLNRLAQMARESKNMDAERIDEAIEELRGIYTHIQVAIDQDVE